MKEKITFCVPTFMRREILIECVSRINHYYPEENILIADQSPDDEKYAESVCKELNVKAEVLNLPFDCGLSFTRNRLLEKATTELVVILDDDMIVKNTRVYHLIDILYKNNLDICGGFYIQPSGKFARWDGKLWIENKVLRFEPIELEEGFTRVDILTNFFVARREKLLNIKWNEDIKIGREHLEFFWRTKLHGMKCAIANIIVADHTPPKDEAYKKYRNRKSILDYNVLVKEIIGVQEVYSKNYEKFNYINN